MNPYEIFLRTSGHNSYRQLYTALEFIAKYKMGLDVLPFPLSALENPPGNKGLTKEELTKALNRR
jgi:hypothetical protein